MSRQYPIVSRAPWCFHFANWLTRHGLRGGHRIQLLARSLGWLNCIVRYAVDDFHSLDVPLFREANCWTRRDIMGYESQAIAYIAKTVNADDAPVTLIDCGADIGTFSVLCAARVRRLERIIAFEPNSEANSILRDNITRLAIAAQHFSCAVSDFRGKAELRTPAYDLSDHGKFIVPSPSGSIEVIRLDDLSLPSHGTTVIKIDVEGEELKVIRGALQTLRNATKAVIVFEANRSVVTRTGVDPVECMRLLGSVRDWDYSVTEYRGHSITFDRPFFDQVPGASYNIGCVTRR